MKGKSTISTTKYLLYTLIVLFCFTSCQREDENSHLADLSATLKGSLDQIAQEEGKASAADYFAFPVNNTSLLPQDPNNPITDDKVELGRRLFHETGIALAAVNVSGMKTYSCASCHHVGAGFQGGAVQSVADGGIGFGFNGQGRDVNPEYDLDTIDVQPIRSPSVLNVAYQTNMLWNGMFGGTHLNLGTEDKWDNPDVPPLATNHLGFEGVETQAIAGLKVHRLTVTKEFVESHDEYRNLFNSVFGGVSESDSINRINAGLAIAAYERTLLASKAPFQQWLAGDSYAMSEKELEGALLFFGKANCVSCHTGPALNKMEFAALGMKDLDAVGGAHHVKSKDFPSKGRGGFTKREQDMYAFKIPQLYNLKDSPFYGHGSSFRTVKEVVNYKNEAQSQHPDVDDKYLDPRFEPLYLSEEEVEQLTEFIEEALYDADLHRYIPDCLPSKLCFPNNDEESRIDMGFDEDQNCN